jgi:hypothetical protein
MADSTTAYTCAICRETFEKGQSDEEAQAEYDRNFPECVGMEQVVICDDCYNDLGRQPAPILRAPRR